MKAEIFARLFNHCLQLLEDETTAAAAAARAAGAELLLTYPPPLTLCGSFQILMLWDNTDQITL